MKKYTARCFQATDGRYLSMDESDKSVIEFLAEDESEAILFLAERQKVDSIYTIEDRWNIHEINKEAV